MRACEMRAVSVDREVFPFIDTLESRLGLRYDPPESCKPSGALGSWRFSPSAQMSQACNTPYVVEKFCFDICYMVTSHRRIMVHLCDVSSSWIRVSVRADMETLHLRSTPSPIGAHKRSQDAGASS